MLNESGRRWLCSAIDSMRPRRASAAWSRFIKARWRTSLSIRPLAYANLASVYLARKDYPRAEKMFREVVQRYTEALSADHLYTGIGQIKLGRALAGEKHYEDAEQHLLAGYKVLMKQTSPSASWLQSARKELVNVYQALDEPEKAAQFRETASASGAGR